MIHDKSTKNIGFAVFAGVYHGQCDSASRPITINFGELRDC